MKIYNIFKSRAIKEGGRNPHVDWFMIVIVSTIVCILTVLGGLYLHNRVNNGDIQSKEQSIATTTKVFDDSELYNVINRFILRESQIIQLKKDFKVSPDPSL